MISSTGGMGLLLFECCRDEEGVCLGVLMLPNLNADLWDTNANLVEKPQQSVVVDRHCRDNLKAHLFIKGWDGSITKENQR